MLENGKLTPNRRIAEACDRVFPNREGWFVEYFQDSQSWIPPGLRSWAEHEDKAVRLDVWCPGNIHGLFQTSEYAEALLWTYPGVTQEQVEARLAGRMARSQRVLRRKGGSPVITAVVDHAALYRLVGSPEVMAGQMGYLLDLAALPNVTLAVLPAVGHPASASELVIADHAATYTEYIGGGVVLIEPDRVSGQERVFNAIRAECYRASESATIVRKAREIWTGESQPTVTHPGGHVSRLPRAAG